MPEIQSARSAGRRGRLNDWPPSTAGTIRSRRFFEQGYVIHAGAPIPLPSVTHFSHPLGTAFRSCQLRNWSTRAFGGGK